MQAGRRGRPALVAVVAAAVVVADQVTKTVAETHLQPYRPRHVLATLDWDLTYNSGAAFSLGQGITSVVEVVVVILVLGLLVVGRRAARTARAPVAAGIGLLLGGAIGNLIDRLVRSNHGAVIDFVDIARVGHRDLWPVFNLADSAIVVGALVTAVVWSRSGPTGGRAGA